MGMHNLNTPIGGPKVPPELSFDLNRILLAKIRLIQPNLSPEHPIEIQAHDKVDVIIAYK